MSQKILGSKDIIIMTISACLGIRWIPFAAGIGPSSLLFWLVGAVLFFLPLSLIVSELSTRYPEEGGLYVWTRLGLGDGPAFLGAWFYWSTNLFYYPALFTFLAVTATYIFNKPELANNESYVTTTVIIAFWAMTFLTIAGLKLSKYVSEFGGIFGTLLLVVALILLGVSSVLVFHHSATPFSLAALLPNAKIGNNLSSLTVLMFAMAGIEVIPTLANAVRQPEKTMARALIITSFIIFFCYALGTVAMNLIASPGELQATSGLLETFRIITTKLHFPWLTQVFAALLAIGDIGGIAIWLLVPAVMFFKSTQKGILPEWLHRHNKHDMPQNALLLQAVIVTMIILVTERLPSVNEMYQVLVLMATIVYFLPYLLVIVAYLKLKFAGMNGPYRVPFGKTGAVILSTVVLLSLILGIMVSFVPTPDLVTFKDKLYYELELAGGPILLILIGLLLYRYRKQ